MANLTEDELKAAFARELLKSPSEPMKAGIALFGDDIGRALAVAREWVNDPIVIAERERILDVEGARSFLPTKEQFALTILGDAQRLDGVLAFEDKLEAYKLFASIMGFIEKPGTTINNNPTTVNRVMVVKEHGDNDEWERTLREQQKKLIANNGETRH